MEILVCIKRVPTVGGRIAVTPDGQEVDTRASGFSISPHEECAVEEAVQITERDGGSVSVLTLGPEAAIEQLRGALALGAHRAVLLETDGREFGPIATAAAIAARVSGVRSVRVIPGCTTVTLMPEGPSSSARFLVIAATATLRTEPTTVPAWRAASPEMLMILPQPAARMCGTKARMHRR